MDSDQVAAKIVDAALKVHSALGAGLLEGAYEACLTHELWARGLTTKRQPPMPVRYGDLVLDIGFRIDMLVQDQIVVELKAVEKLLPIHRAQLLTYLKLGSYRLGLLLNFNTVHMRDGIQRLVYGPAGVTR